MSKTTALLAGLAMIALFGAAAFLFPDSGALLLNPILTAVVSLTAAYIGIQAANNGVKGKFWNQALYDAEHNNREEK